MASVEGAWFSLLLTNVIKVHQQDKISFGSFSCHYSVELWWNAWFADYYFCRINGTFAKHKFWYFTEKKKNIFIYVSQIWRYFLKKCEPLWVNLLWSRFVKPCYHGFLSGPGKTRPRCKKKKNTPSLFCSFTARKQGKGSLTVTVGIRHAVLCINA